MASVSQIGWLVGYFTIIVLSFGAIGQKPVDVPPIEPIGPPVLGYAMLAAANLAVLTVMFRKMIQAARLSARLIARRRAKREPTEFERMMSSDSTERRK